MAMVYDVPNLVNNGHLGRRSVWGLGEFFIVRCSFEMVLGIVGVPKVPWKVVWPRLREILKDFEQVNYLQRRYSSLMSLAFQGGVVWRFLSTSRLLPKKSTPFL